MASSSLNIDELAHGDWAVGDAACLRDRWQHLENAARGSETARKKQRDDYEDAASAEDRIKLEHQTRYAMELLQNAHDAIAAGPQASGRVWFHATDTALIVANEGEPFTASRLKSLVRLGASDKLAGERSTIGYKGIGFAAVFSISDRPQILSAPGRFQLDAHRAAAIVSDALQMPVDKVAARNFPLPLSENELVDDRSVVASLFDDGAVTVIRLPYRADVSRSDVVAGIDAELAPEVLLFMPAVSEIAMVDRCVQQSRRRHDSGLGELVRLNGERTSPRRWLVSHVSTELPSKTARNLHDDLWSQVTELRGAVAVPWKAGKPNPGPPQPTFVYYPTNESTGRSLLFHGDFYVDSARQHIQTDKAQGAVTALIADALVAKACELAEHLSDGDGLFVRCLTPTAPTTKFGEWFNARLDAALVDVPFVPTCTGERVPPSKAAVYETAPLTDRQTDDLSELLAPRGGAVPAASTVLRSAPSVEWLDRIGAVRWNARTLGGALNPPARSPSISYERALSALAAVVDLLGVKTWCLHDRPVLQDTAGEWATPDQLFRPAESAIGLPKAMPAELAPRLLKVPRGKASRDFVERLDTGELDTAAAVKLVSGLVADEQWGVNGDEPRAVLDWLRRVWRHDKAVLERQDLGHIRVPARTATTKKRSTWRRADEAYLSSEWSGDDSLERMYGWLDEREFVPAPDSESQRNRQRAFLLALGVGDRPRRRDERLRDIRNPPTDKKAWGLSEAVVASVPCGEHPYTARECVVPTLDRLVSVLTAGPAEARSAFAGFWAQARSDDWSAAARCTSQAHRKSKPTKLPGLVPWFVENTAWVPVAGSRDPLRPGDTWFDLPTTRTLDLPAADLPADVANAVGAVNAARPRPEHIVAALQRLRRDHPRLWTAPDTVWQTSVWLADALGALASRRDGAVERPPLPALRAGDRVWSENPAVGDLPGAEQLPIKLLECANGHRLVDWLDLPRASDLVAVTVKPSGEASAPGWTAPVQVAGLVAVLRAHGADLESAARHLGLLVEAAWRELRLTIEHAGASVTVDATHYIEIDRDADGGLVGARLHMRSDWDRHIVDIAKTLNRFIGPPYLADTITAFLSIPDAHRQFSVTDDDLADAEEAIERYVARRPHPAPSPSPDASPAEDAQESRSDHLAGDSRATTSADPPPVTGTTSRGTTPGSRRSPPLGSGGGESTSSASSPASRREASATSPSTDRRYISYVEPGPAAAESSTDGSADRSSIDAAGVAAVMAFEAAAGRDPEEMPPANPGFDVKSTDPATGDVRRIEVKSLSGEWGTAGVGLSKRQFLQSLEDKDNWLYVVEHAQTDHARRITQIRRPAVHAAAFYLDHNWKTLGDSPGRKD